MYVNAAKHAGPGSTSRSSDAFALATQAIRRSGSARHAHLANVRQFSYNRPPRRGPRAVVTLASITPARPPSRAPAREAPSMDDSPPNSQNGRRIHKSTTAQKVLGSTPLEERPHLGPRPASRPRKSSSPLCLRRFC